MCNKIIFILLFLKWKGPVYLFHVLEVHTLSRYYLSSTNMAKPSTSIYAPNLGVSVGFI